MGLLDYLEYGLGSSLSRFRGHDAKLFIKGPAFADIQPTIQITSPDVGPSDSVMAIKYTGLGGPIPRTRVVCTANNPS